MCPQGRGSKEGVRHQWRPDHSEDDGNLNSFHLLAMVNNVTKNMGTQTSVHALTFTFFIHQEVELLDDTIVLLLIF